MNIKEILEKFSKTKIAVVGDVMLDRYIYGSTERASPEAPILIVKQEEEEYRLGGAANVAANITSLGGSVWLFGYTGRDAEKEVLSDLFKSQGINPFLFGILKHTTLKTRVIGRRGINQQIVRLDREVFAEADEGIEEKIVREIETISPEIIVASDYGKGTLSSSLFSLIKRYAAEKGKKIIVDPRPRNKENYKGIYLVTPNLQEAEEMSGLREVKDAGRVLQEELACNVLLTKGRDGMTLFEKDKIVNLPTKARGVSDVSGAGDTVVSIMALGLASNLSLEESAILANHAAGIVVGRFGTANVSGSDLEQEIEKEHRKILNLEELRIIVKDYKLKGKKIVWTNGCFDILHSGHVRYLKEARKLGDILIVGINDDNSVRQLKGEGRPVMPESERAEILSSLEQVDYVMLFPETTVEKYLQELKPDIYVKGGDYQVDTINQQERKIIESYGGKTAFIPTRIDASSSKIIAKIRDFKQKTL